MTESRTDGRGHSDIAPELRQLAQTICAAKLSAYRACEAIARRPLGEIIMFRHIALAALNLVAEKAKWDQPLPAGRFRGVAVHEAFQSYVAQVVEISMEKGQPKVHKVTCAIDLGVAVNPDGAAGAAGVELGACGAWPEAGRACSAFLVEHDGFRLLVDVGYAALPRLLRECGWSEDDSEG